jgi:hypothetical protein
MRLSLTFSRTRPLFQRLSAETKEKYNSLLSGYVLNVLSPEFDNQITGKKWIVPWQSLRFEKGSTAYQVPPGPRDIVDSGDLLNSKFEQVVSGRYGDIWSVSWLADHASAVRFGYTTYWGRYAPERLKGKYIGNDMPGRDWITAALEEKPLKQYLNSQLGKVGAGKVNVGKAKVVSFGPPGFNQS